MNRTVVYSTQVIADKRTPDGRIWLEGHKLKSAGIEIGTLFRVATKDGALILKETNSEGTGTIRVSGRMEKDHPIIDTRAKKIVGIFSPGEKLVATIKKGLIIIRRAIQTLRTQAREKRFLSNMAKGLPMTMASLFHGAGTLDRALHDGMSKAGTRSKLNIISEIEGSYIDASLKANRDLFADDAIILEGPIQDFRPRNLPYVDWLSAGIPCTGASTSGRAKGKLAHAESHDKAGSMAHYVINWIQALEPIGILIENVKQYLNTASFEILRQTLEQMDYTISTRVMNGNEMGALENRDRMVMVAISNGLAKKAAFNLEHVEPQFTKEATLGEVFDNIPDDSPEWREFSYLVKKEARDIAAGKGFRRQLFRAEDASINTLTKGLQKARSTDPFIQHPSNPELSRIPTEAEHARFKKMPEGWIASTGLSKTKAHEVLGNGVVYAVFYAVGVSISNWINSVTGASRGLWSHEKESCTLSMIA